MANTRMVEFHVLHSPESRRGLGLPKPNVNEVSTRHLPVFDLRSIDVSWQTSACSDGRSRIPGMPVMQRPFPPIASQPHSVESQLRNQLIASTADC
jgi:hypothetical protein